MKPKVAKFILLVLLAAMSLGGSFTCVSGSGDDHHGGSTQRD